MLTRKISWVKAQTFRTVPTQVSRPELHTTDSRAEFTGEERKPLGKSMRGLSDETRFTPIATVETLDTVERRHRGNQQASHHGNAGSVMVTHLLGLYKASNQVQVEGIWSQQIHGFSSKRAFPRPLHHDNLSALSDVSLTLASLTSHEICVCIRCIIIAATTLACVSQTGLDVLMGVAKRQRQTHQGNLKIRLHHDRTSCRQIQEQIFMGTMTAVTHTGSVVYEMFGD